MKEKDVLVDCEAQQYVIYAEKSDGSFSPVQTGSYMTKNHISDLHGIVADLSSALLVRLRKGEISPIYYFMTIEELSVGELAARAGFSKSAVKKHIEPKGFNDLSVSKLRRYADILNIPVANFFQIINTREEMNWNVGYVTEAHESEPVQISQIKTENPIVVETKLVQNTR